MPLREISADDSLAVDREQPVVVVPVFGAHDLFVRCLRSVLQHTPPDVPVLVADDHGPEPASLAWVRELDARGALAHKVAWLRQPENLGFLGNCNVAFAVTAPGDVVLVNSDVVVCEGWLEGLRDAALSDTLIASATALTNHGTILSVPYRNTPIASLPQSLDLDECARRVRTRSPRLRPRIPSAIGHCVYLRRPALDLVGGFDEAFAPAYGEEVDWCQRALLRGLQHVAADDVLVLHQGMGSLGVEGERNPIQDAHEALLASRYPAYHAGVRDVEADEHGPLARSLNVASRAIVGLGVTIDGRCLTGSHTGTQVLTLELIRALHRSGRAQIRVLLPHPAGDDVVAALDALEGVTYLDVAQLDEAIHRTHVVHRPFQVAAGPELRDLALVGHRLVITQQDLIAYRNQGYFANAEQWLAYRSVTREALALADRVVFSSPHAAADAQADALVPPSRSAVVPIGVDHTAPPDGVATVPGGLAAHTEQPYLLVLGTDFRHKNRVFALELLAALRERHGWEGRLVLAGPQVFHGSSAGDEAAWRSLHAEHEAALTVLPAVAEAEKHWLMAHAAAVVYPSTYEGFGFLPFEAATAGRPCFFAHASSLGDHLAGATAVLVPWDAAASADRAIEVLRDEGRAQALVEEVRAVAAELTWDAMAAQVLAVYEEALDSPVRDAMRLDGDRMLTDAAYWTLRHQIGPTGLTLVGPEGRLLPDEAQRTLAALARRPVTRGPLLGALRAVRRLAPGEGAVNGGGGGHG